MSDLWDRMPDEPLRWFERFTKFRLMEPLHSIADVYRDELPEAQKGAKRRKKPPGRWYETAKAWKWEERAAAWDTHETERVEAINAREHEKALRKGYALLHKRVEALEAVARKLEGYLDDESKVWLDDAKIVATGMGLAEKVDLKVFNHDLFKEYREYMDDIAEEVGGRVKKNTVSITFLPKEYHGIDPHEDGVDK